MLAIVLSFSFVMFSFTHGRFSFAVLFDMCFVNQYLNLPYVIRNNGAGLLYIRTT